MGESPLFPAQRRVRCPSCGSERLHLRDEVDPIDRLVQTPADRLRRLFSADMRLYHCRVCRLQFYDAGPAMTREPLATEPPGAVSEKASVGVAPTLPEANPKPLQKPPIGGSLIGESVTIRGRVWCGEDLALRGIVQGDIDISAHRLTVEEHGSLTGDVTARAIGIRAGGAVRGDIQTNSLDVEDGGFLKGRVQMRQPQ